MVDSPVHCTVLSRHCSVVSRCTLTQMFGLRVRKWRVEQPIHLRTVFRPAGIIRAHDIAVSKVVRTTTHQEALLISLPADKMERVNFILALPTAPDACCDFRRQFGAFRLLLAQQVSGRKMRIAQLRCDGCALHDLRLWHYRTVWRKDTD